MLQRNQGTHRHAHDRAQLARLAEQGAPRRVPQGAAQGAHEDVALARREAGQAPQIVSPLRGETYTRRVSRGGEERIALHATVDAGVQSVYWFVGDDFVGESKAGDSLLWQPQLAGNFTVRAIDDHGRADARPLRVEVTE